MAITVQSVSAVATVSSTDTVTITKPTGLAVGDLLVAVLAGYAGDGSGVGDINIKSGWTDAETNKLAETANSIQYKIADAADVAAANFSFTKTAATDSFVGQLIRASGQNTFSPLGSSQNYSNNTAESASFSGTMSSYTPGADGALVIIQVNGEWQAGGTIRTVSDYAATNVSFTEGIDTGGSDGSGGATVASAYGIQSTNAALTGYTATFSTSTNDHYGQIVVFIPPVPASGSNDLATGTSTTFTQTGTADGIGGNTLATATTTAFTQGGYGAAPTQWTNEDLPSTTWTNEQL